MPPWTDTSVVAGRFDAGLNEVFAEYREKDMFVTYCGGYNYGWRRHGGSSRRSALPSTDTSSRSRLLSGSHKKAGSSKCLVQSQRLTMAHRAAK